MGVKSSIVHTFILIEAGCVCMLVQCGKNVIGLWCAWQSMAGLHLARFGRLLWYEPSRSIGLQWAKAELLSLCLGYRGYFAPFMVGWKICTGSAHV